MAVMHEHPILFSGDMVRAILDGRKTQTRRPVTFPASLWFNADGYPFSGDGYTDCRPVEPGDIRAWITCPFGVQGDRLWVRETWRPVGPWDTRRETIQYRTDGMYLRKTGWPKSFRIRTNNSLNKWRPSIHMPRWASRINLEVTAVRVERVQDITYGDLRAEGLRCPRRDELDNLLPVSTAFDAWKILWNSIYAKRGLGWDENPWVWVVEFTQEKVAAAEDAQTG